MQQPTDYPLEPEELPENPIEVDPEKLTYAALLDRVADEKPITEEMIRIACKKMEAAQQFPFGTEPHSAQLVADNNPKQG